MEQLHGKEKNKKKRKIKMADCVSGIIPKPVEMKFMQGSFNLNERSVVFFDKASSEIKKIADYFVSVLESATGYAIKKAGYLSGSIPKNSILLTSRKVSANLGKEGYQISVSKNNIIICASDTAGMFYGVQTARQLFSADIFLPTLQKRKCWNVPAVEIMDKPRFAWRGLMLDVGRHYMPVEFIKRFLDLMAIHKLNTFHWHLTEDQGWRIEIKKYPKLTHIGSKRSSSPVRGDREKQDGVPYGPYFYTQDEVCEIVKYAQERCITVVPEIEMPGHSVEVLSAYPELGCTGGHYSVRTKWGIEDDVFCAGNDAVFTFLENVLDEVMELFPGEFIHIGGDECPKKRWEKCPKCQARIKTERLKDEHELQSYFIRKIERFLNKRGRRLIGWDEILEGGLAPNATVMSWRGTEGGIKAAQAGHDVVMTPKDYCYFDYYQSENGESEPEAIGGVLPLDKVYLYNPVPFGATNEEAGKILGVQGNLWTEYIYTPQDVEYMAYPRACALAEIAWAGDRLKNFCEFETRLKKHLRRLDVMQVNYRKNFDNQKR